MQRVKQIAILTDFEFETLLDYSNLFNTYSNTTLIKNTKAVMKDVTNIVPIDFIVAIKLRLNVPFNPFLVLSNGKYH